jgi:branched-chain amino acid transport system ATP-binding protein
MTAPAAAPVASGVDPGAPLLRAIGLSAGHGSLAAVRDLDLEVHRGEVVALLGANGAGETTTLLTLAGELAPLAGEIELGGRPARGSLYRRARDGVGLITEEKSVFMGLTVAENLRLGSGGPEAALELFPELRDHIGRRAGLLSGGQQQMLALARALAAEPSLLLADELSLGLAPLLVRRLLAALRAAADERGVGVLLVEQHVRRALEVADRAYVLSRGRIVLSAPTSELRGRMEEIEASYLSALA